MKNTKFVLVFALLAAFSAVTAQNTNTRIIGQSVCHHEIVEVPITVSNLSNVAAISLAFNYDTTRLTYLGYRNISDSLTGSNLDFNIHDGICYFVWAGTRNISIPSDTLFVVRFLGKETGNATLSWNTAQCEYSNLSGTAQTSGYYNATVSVWALPVISSSPQNQSIMTTQSTYFQVSASGQGLSYQWQVRPEFSHEWVNVTNNSNHSGCNSNRLNINNAILSMNGNEYRCVVSGSCQPSQTSGSALLTVSDFITITTQAGSASACPDSIFAIPVNVTNFRNVGAFSLVLNYDTTRIQFAGHQNVHESLTGNAVNVNATGGKVYITWANATPASIGTGTATLFELKFKGASGGANFSWQTAMCEYSDPNGRIFPTNYSNGSANIYYVPSITSQPTDRTINMGQSTTFSIGASGQGLNFHWQESTDGGVEWTDLTNGGHYNNVFSSNLQVNNTESSMDGYLYRCVVSGTCPPAVVSNPAMLHLILPTITTSLTGGSYCPNETFDIHVNVTNCNNIGAISLALSYDTTKFEFVGHSNVHTSMGANNMYVNARSGIVYMSWASASGASIGNDRLLTLQFKGQTGSGTFAWKNQTSGLCEYSTPSGNLVPMAFSNTSVTIYQVPVITSQPENRSVYALQSTTFVVSASGQGLNYQWQESTDWGINWTNLANGGHYANVTGRDLRVNNIGVEMNGLMYRCIVGGTCGEAVVSDGALLTVDVTQPVVIARPASSHCAGIVSQPVTGNYLNNIGAISLVMNYDSTILRNPQINQRHPYMAENFEFSHTSNGKIYIVWASATPRDFGTDTLFYVDFDCSSGSSNTSWDVSQCEIADGNGNLFNASYQGGRVSVNPDFIFDDLDYSDMDAITPTLSLAAAGIVTGHNCQVRPYDNITRSEMAKIAYLGLFGGNVSLVSDHFPSPFLDMQNTETYFYKYAKALSYLEYRDGVSPFDRNKMNFNPGGTIERILVLKVLLETFNIAPLENDSSYYNDVPTSLQHYGYVNAAFKAGIIPAGQDFRPFESCKRIEAFNMLYNLMQNLQTTPTVTNNLDMETSDFFIPGNYTPYNFTSVLGVETGNFKQTEKSSFSIPGRGIPLEFSHTYNSFLTELPNQILPIQPLGVGWTHSYNSYIINTDLITDDYGNPLSKPAIIVFWADGTVNVYDNDNNPTHPTAITKGVYDEVTRVSGDEYKIVTKDQTEYEFSRISGAAADAPYMMTAVSDRHGNRTVLAYEVGERQEPRLTRVTDATGRALNFTYKPGNNYIATVSDPLNRIVRFDVVNDNLCRYDNANGDSTRYYYDTRNHYYAHLLDSIRLPKGNVITNEYEQRKLTSTKSNNSSPISITHNPAYANNSNVFYSSTVSTAIDASHNVATNYQYNKDGLCTKQTTNNIEETTSYYENSSDPTLLTKSTNTKTGVTTQYTYDNRGNVVKIIMSGGNASIVQEYTYDNSNNLLSYKDPNGNQTFFYYSNGNLTTIKNALSQETHLEYNAYGEISRVEDASGASLSIGYDAHGNPNLYTLNALSISASKEYDIASRLTKAINYDGTTNQYTYDNADQLLTEKNHLGYITRYKYDKNGNLTTIYNAKGDSTVLTYDFANDYLLSETFQGISKHYTYNSNGTLKSYTSPNGDILSIVYDNDGRILNDGYASYQYASNGSVSSITKDGKSTTYEYDALQRTTKITYDGKSVGYSYDNNGNITSILYPNGQRVRYTYNALNKLQTVTDWNNHTTQYTYRPDEQIASIKYPNNLLTTFTYDNQGRNIGQSSVRNNGNGSVLVNYQVSLDNVGNHLQETILDVFDNIPVKEIPSLQYTYNNGNRLLSDGLNDYQYDYNGNMTSKGSKAYRYDVKNCLVQYNSGGSQILYTYDAGGNRRSRSIYGVKTNYVLDYSGGKTPRILAEYDASGNEKCCYIYGMDLIARILPSNATEYYVSDVRGSVVAMTDATDSAVVTHKYLYNDFGVIVDFEETDYNPFRFLGCYGVTYEDSDLYFMHARYYDPTIGRFLSEDPVWSTNLYPYADNNPLSLIDPWGSISLEKVGSHLKQVATIFYRSTPAGAMSYCVKKTKETVNKVWEKSGGKALYEKAITKSVEAAKESKSFYQNWAEDLEASGNTHWFKYFLADIGGSLCDLWINDFSRELIISTAGACLLGHVNSAIFTKVVGVKNINYLNTSIYGKTRGIGLLKMSTTKGRIAAIKINNNLNDIYAFVQNAWTHRALIK